MTRDEIISDNPIAEFIRDRGHELKRAGENFKTNACPVAEHKKFHRPNTINPAKNLWHCNDCDVGGSVIDWLIHEKDITAADALLELGGGPDGTNPQIIATYHYTDEGSNLLFQIGRFDRKIFKARRGPDDPEYKLGIKGVRRVLYRLPELIKAQLVCVTEGEKNADDLAALGFVATTNPFGAGKWRDEYSETLRDKDVVIFGDADEKGQAHVEEVIESLTGIARSIKRMHLPEGFHDVSDYIKSFSSPDEAKTAIEKLIDQAATAQSEPGNENDEATIARLAGLSPIEYDRVRLEEAEKLGVRIATLDAERERKRAKSSEGETLQGNAVDFLDVAPYETSVNGAQVLDEIAGTFNRYLVLPAGAADTLALWVTQTHCYEAFEHVARLNCCSPDKQCGKTTTLDVTERFVARPLRAENITTAVLFRLVEKYKPTLLLDEVDTYLNENEELRGCLNSGHKRGGKVYRCEGQDNTVRSFAVFAPAALAGIGALPGTLHDRSVVIKLARAKPGEIAARFDSRKVEYESELYRKLARWTADNFDRLKNCDPQLPQAAFNRLADNWRPLFAIAEIAGDDWPERAHAAFVALTSSADLDAQGIGTLLLSDTAAIFTAEGTDRLPSSNLAESLAAIEGRPWAEWGKHRKPISTNQLANQLRRFGISPRGIRVGDETPRGYLLDDFKEAFSRYLPDTPFPDCNSATTLGKTPIFKVQQDDSVLHPEKAASQRGCCGVAPQNTLEGGKRDKVI